ncbi:MAG: ribosome maturation factor RimP [Thermoflexibacter sp.]|nr:ribosome maturation factor RimP [Thermoflexibacter sp.]
MFNSKNNPNFVMILVERRFKNGEVIPLFYSIYTMDLKNKIKEIIETALSEDLFLVDLKIYEKNRKYKLVILLDGDKGITLDQCASVSRKVGEMIENQNLFEDSYLLEVSSTGIDLPLKMNRQYLSRIGRKLKVELTDGTIKHGILQAVSEDKIILLPEKNKKEHKQKDGAKIKPEEMLLGIAFAEIKQTTVLINFN